MLEKIVVVLVGLLTSIVGALSPESNFASHPTGADASLSTAVTQETLATLRTADGSTFAKLNVLWVEVDGHRVTDDAWGTGQVKEIQFKVGVKNVDGMALAVGDKQIPLHPTDVLTIRMFEGDFSYRGMGTPAATIQLQGTVKTTLLNQGAAHAPLRTQNGQLTPSAVTAAPATDASSIAYVVLDTGEKVQTVDLASGGARVFTHDTSASAAGSIMASWVKIDGQIVRDYTAGSGTVGSIEFQPATPGARPQMLNFGDNGTRLDAKSRMHISDFVGDYVVSQMGGSLLQLKLDGFASSVTTGGDSPLPVQAGTSGPLAHFDIAPTNPATTDTITFTDGSSDPDGIVVFRHWDFGDGNVSVVPNPTHRYAKPGTYDAVLNVTDNDLNTAEMHLPITVRNADPVPDFDFAPKSVTTQTLVTFSDKSFDPDGTVVGWVWDFGDGEHLTTRAATHTFHHPGPATVTLTVTDELGGSNSLSKVVIVQNTPPLAGFSFTPAQPLSATQVQFISNATDPDGTIVNVAWDFGDGTTGTGSAPTHAFAQPGVFTVAQTVTDDSGATDTASTQVNVQNRPPVVDFVSGPVAQPASVPITFQSTSTDVDGRIVLTSWDFGDGSGSSQGTTVTHTFPHAGSFPVTITATDNSLAQSSFTRSVTVANAAPNADFNSNVFAPRNVTTQLVDTSRDPDGDPVVNQQWDFGDGSPTGFGKVVNHTWTALGTYTITLHVEDNQGHPSTATRQIRIVNANPVPFVNIAPDHPIAGQPVWINTSVSDPDSLGPFTYNIEYTDGSPVDHAASVTHIFTLNGPTQVTVSVGDSDGGQSTRLVKKISIDLADPVVNWSIDPAIPTQNSPANLTDLSHSANGALTAWAWNFGDQTTSTVQNPQHTWTAAGAYTVTLTVRDIKGRTMELDRALVVNARPVPLFDTPSTVQPLNTHIQFRNHSFDPDGSIVAATWDFGDGTVSTTENPDHADHLYTMPGPHQVSLLVQDNRGALGFTMATVNIANQPPIARFDVTGPTPLYMVGQTLTFHSTSYDPDGQALTNVNWSFGDGSFGTGDTITHTFAHTGIYHVALNVSDGITTSHATIRTLRIGADHAVTINVLGVDPDGTPADLLDPSEFTLSMTVSRLGEQDVYPNALSSFVPAGNGIAITLPPGTWLGNDALQLRLDSPLFRGLPLLASATLRDTSGITDAPSFTFQIPLPLKVSVAPDAGERTFISRLGIPIVDPFPENPFDPDGEPVYRDFQERFHGTGTVKFADNRLIQAQPGDPGPLIVIEARYLPMRVVGVVRDSTVVADSALNNNAAIGWCRAAIAHAYPNGTYEWTFDANGCLSNAVDVYPIGRWEVRAKASYNWALSAKSETQEIIVDPTGGLLWTLGAPP